MGKNLNKMMQHYINHIALVVDSSGSMESISKEVVNVFDRELGYLKTRSVELKQETRISIYLFGSVVSCLVFDMDVMRITSLRDYYVTGGMTSLLDATGKAIQDMDKLPELYGDHAFLVYVMTDGEENNSKIFSVSRLKDLLQSLKENWTIACLVPDAKGIYEAKKFGFPVDNIQVWDSTSKLGIETVGKNFKSSMDNYMTLRSQGVRGTKSFFKTDLSKVGVNDVKAISTRLNKSEYEIFYVKNFLDRDSYAIRNYIEYTLNIIYGKGSVFYELTKAETIQKNKDILIQSANGDVFWDSARSVLGLPVGEDVRVHPGNHGNWKIFVQSTSVNRKLVPGTNIIILK
jgi:hypothetical protein